MIFCYKDVSKKQPLGTKSGFFVFGCIRYSKLVTIMVFSGTPLQRENFWHKHLLNYVNRKPTLPQEIGFAV